MVNKMVYGSIFLGVGRLVVTKVAQYKTAQKVLGGFIAFTGAEYNFSSSKFEMMDCEIIIIPKKIYRKGPFRGRRLEQVITELGQGCEELFEEVVDMSNLKQSERGK